MVTYLNSGNVVFDSALSASHLTQLIEDELERAFVVKVPTLVKTSAEVIAIAESIPSEWGSNADEQTYVAYLFSDVDKPSIVSELPVKRQFMSIFYAPGAIVWNIKRENYNRSQITRDRGTQLLCSDDHAQRQHSEAARGTVRPGLTEVPLPNKCVNLARPSAGGFAAAWRLAGYAPHVSPRPSLSTRQ